MNFEATVFLVDDDQHVRDAIAWLIESVDLPVKTYASAAMFLESFDGESPGCLVLDVRMPGMSGLELQRNLADRNCKLPVIIITGYADVSVCVRAFESGAFAFLQKPIDHQALLRSIHEAIEKDRGLRQKAVLADEILRGLVRLTPREREVMDLIIAGESMKDIGRTLQISLPTCSKHRAKLLAKMKVKNDVLLVRRMLEWQIVESEHPARGKQGTVR